MVTWFLVRDRLYNHPCVCLCMCLFAVLYHNVCVLVSQLCQVWISCTNNWPCVQCKNSIQDDKGDWLCVHSFQWDWLQLELPKEKQPKKIQMSFLDEYKANKFINLGYLYQGFIFMGGWGALWATTQQVLAESAAMLKPRLVLQAL